ncbi:MAG: M1 family metallopeptidase [Actinobacteria bacterium]|nr:M1 family metallopeptidase [Actinomycetota bacterium]
MSMNPTPEATPTSPPMTDPTPEHATVSPDQAYRLPRTATPSCYRIVITPDLTEATFEGSVEIDVDVNSRNSSLVCNAADLDIFDAHLTLSDGRTIEADVTIDEGSERATFSFDEEIPIGSSTLSCRFSGTLNDQLRGFYRSTFTDLDGATHTIATTQMESTDARRAFPCWDEPDLKAVFEVTLIVDPGVSAISNSPIVETSDGGGKTRVRFSPTMKMSTYLVAFVVGPFEATEPIEVDGVLIRVIHVPGKSHLTSFALEVAAHAVKFFSDYFDIPYPAEKLDLVAIPDFAFGAMENLGCVTFRETALLVEEDAAARVDLERVADVVAHEIAHMWFGDLVTMKWWEGIWLNEAFATFMEVLCVDSFRPEWQRWTTFGTEREAALAVDGLESTRPIEYPVGSPEEADGMFDVLTYQKGGSVLRMLERYVGREAFRRGVGEYLKKHAYSNTVTTDLWDALESASGEPVRAVMDSWILQGGYPVVSVERDTLTQEPFRYGSRRPKESSAIGDQWQIPLLIRPVADTSDQREAQLTTVLLSEKSMRVETPDFQTGPTLINAGGWGLYRVAYDEDDLDSISSDMSRLDPLERFNLVADTWAAVLSGSSGLERFLTLAMRLQDEDDPAVWGIVVGAIRLVERIANEDLRAQLAIAARKIFGRRFEEIGWDPRPEDTQRTPTLRNLLITVLGTVGEDEAVRLEASRRFESDLDGRAGALYGDIESGVLSSIATRARREDFESVLARYRSPLNPQAEMRNLYALAEFLDLELCLRTFDLAMKEVRTQNAPYLIGALLFNLVGGEAVWDRVKSSWEVIIERFPSNSHSRMLDSVRGLCTRQETASDVEGFLAQHPLRTGQKTVTQALERLRVNLAFSERERERLNDVLARFDQ